MSRLMRGVCDSNMASIGGAEKSGNFACEDETFYISKVLITNFVAQSISVPPILRLVLQATEDS